MNWDNDRQRWNIDVAILDDQRQLVKSVVDFINNCQKIADIKEVQFTPISLTYNTRRRATFASALELVESDTSIDVVLVDLSWGDPELRNLDVMGISLLETALKRPRILGCIYTGQNPEEAETLADEFGYGNRLRNIAKKQQNLFLPVRQDQQAKLPIISKGADMTNDDMQLQFGRRIVRFICESAVIELPNLVEEVSLWEAYRTIKTSRAEVGSIVMSKQNSNSVSLEKVFPGCDNSTIRDMLRVCLCRGNRFAEVEGMFARNEIVHSSTHCDKAAQEHLAELAKNVEIFDVEMSRSESRLASFTTPSRRKGILEEDVKRFKVFLDGAKLLKLESVTQLNLLTAPLYEMRADRSKQLNDPNANLKSLIEKSLDGVKINDPDKAINTLEKEIFFDVVGIGLGFKGILSILKKETITCSIKSDVSKVWISIGGTVFVDPLHKSKHEEFELKNGGLGSCFYKFWATQGNHESNLSDIVGMESIPVTLPLYFVPMLVESYGSYGWKGADLSCPYDDSFPDIDQNVFKSRAPGVPLLTQNGLCFHMCYRRRRQ